LITTFIGGAMAKGAPTTAPAAPAPEEAAEMERIEPPVKKAKGAVVSGAVVDAADEACGKTGVGRGQQASTSAVSAEATAAERGRGPQVAQPTVKERQRKRKRAARGTPDTNGGEIKTDHKHMNDLYWLVRDHHEAALRLYANEQRDMLGRRFITDRPGIGKTAKAPLSLNRTNAMGCSERAVARELMSDEFKDMLDKLHTSVIQDTRFEELSIDELDRALLWGCLRYQAWPKEVAKAVLHEAGCFFGLLLPLNVYAGGFATAEHERKYAWYHHQSELGRMHYMPKFFKTNGQIDHNHVGMGKFELDVAQAGVDGRARSFAFDSRDDFCRIIATLRVGSADVAGAPHVQPEDEPDGGRAYSHEFLRTFGDPDGHHLMPGARGWTIYRLVDGARTRLCGRESWGMGSIIPDAVGIPEDGHPLSGERDATLGFSKLLTPPRDTRERGREAKTLRAYEQTAKAALRTAAARLDGADTAARAVRAVVALCGKRLNTLDDEFAPQLAAARGAVLAACPSLQPELDAYIAHSKVLAMHDARPQVIGHEAAAVACLDEESQGQLKSARAEGRTDIVADLLAKAFSMLSAKGAVACLDEESQGQLKSARAEGRTDVVADLLAKAFSLLGAKGHEAAAVACLDEESQGQLKSARAKGRTDIVADLLAKAFSMLSAKGAVACLDEESQGQLKSARAEGRTDVVADLLAKGRSLRGAKGHEGAAVASLDEESQGQIKSARAEGRADVVADLLAKGRSLLGALQPLNRKAPGCKVIVTELTPNGREGECILKANRLEKTRRFQIACEANGGVFGYKRFVLYVSDAKSGAEADNLGNIIKLPPFIIAKDGRRFECKFTEFIAMANVASSAAGVDLAEAVVP
jgi:hypothetical protein